MPEFKPQFQHDCAHDTLITIVPGLCDIYRQCGIGFLVRYGNDGPMYGSSVSWTLSDALNYAAYLAAHTRG